MSLKRHLKKRDELTSSVYYTTELKNIRDCDFIVEAITEKLQPKIELFREI